eukprot:TRINITY_DN24005_c0_g1_i2.p1 TRINITY_DN24005_c0_g1~~TRINITY_DN24005_c0_g1_i2.p1  ORF type:complete len:108 (-),score=8.44 TRINITY_DN24005_c0_g1_i2:285-608(-)
MTGSRLSPTTISSLGQAKRNQFHCQCPPIETTTVHLSYHFHCHPPVTETKKPKTVPLTPTARGRNKSIIHLLEGEQLLPSIPSIRLFQSLSRKPFKKSCKSWLVYKI